MSDFVTLPGSLETTGETLFAVRLLPPGDGSGGLLVADYANIKRLDALGNVVATYDVPGEPGENSWFALNLDPNGTSFWSGGLESSNFYRFSILTGAIEVGPINTGAPGGTMGGICLKSEPTGSGTTVTKTFPAGQTTKQRYDFVTHAWVTAFAPTATCLPYGPTCILYSLPHPPQPTQYSGLIHVYIDYFVPINACRPRLLHLFETGPKAGTVEDMTRDYYPPPSIPSIDPIGGDTDGFSQFQAVDLGDPDGPLQNAFAGFVKPNPDGTSLITSGRTLPVLFKFTGAPPVARLSVEKIQNTVTGFVLQDTDAPGNSFTDNLFKCDSLTKQCQYNLKTTGFMTGTYVIVVNADTFCVQTVRFSVR
ncbi:MAG: hypothetical protein DMF91_28300 [Acidobacteria bacterium]|nr:MAG: hypothetical protein DMF91_28300 [Acidobacteriota bacterium]